MLRGATASNSSTETPSFDMKTDKNTSTVKEIERICLSDLNTLYNCLIQFLNTSIFDGEQHHERIVDLILRIVKIYPKCHDLAQQQLTSSLNVQ